MIQNVSNAAQQPLTKKPVKKECASGNKNVHSTMEGNPAKTLMAEVKKELPESQISDDASIHCATNLSSDKTTVNQILTSGETATVSTPGVADDFCVSEMLAYSPSQKNHRTVKSCEQHGKSRDHEGDDIGTELQNNTGPENSKTDHLGTISAQNSVRQATLFLNRHMENDRGHTEGGSFKCDMCQRTFSRKSSVKRHKRIHTGERPFKCGLCQASFCQLSHLRYHMMRHTGERPFKCGMCEAAFCESSEVRTHMRIHTGERPFSCDICQATFRQLGHLTTHMRKHTGEKPFKCDMCQAAFAQFGDLRNHMTRHTGERPFKCNVCQAAFRRKITLTEHKRIHTKERPFRR